MKEGRVRAGVSLVGKQASESSPPPAMYFLFRAAVQVADALTHISQVPHTSLEHTGFHTLPSHAR